MAERRCSIPGCTTILSAYNDDSRCWVHQDRKFIKGAGTFKLQRIAEVADDLTEEEAARYRRMDWSQEYRG